MPKLGVFPIGVSLAAFGVWDEHLQALRLNPTPEKGELFLVASAAIPMPAIGVGRSAFCCQCVFLAGDIDVFSIRRGKDTFLLQIS